MPCPLCGDICECASGAGSDAELLPARLEIQGMDEPSLQSPAESASSAGDNQPAPEDSAAWRQEVAARLNRYQSGANHGPRAIPRYACALRRTRQLVGDRSLRFSRRRLPRTRLWPWTSSVSRFQSLGRCTRPRLIPLPTPQQFLTERKFRSRRRLPLPSPGRQPPLQQRLLSSRAPGRPPARA